MHGSFYPARVWWFFRHRYNFAGKFCHSLLWLCTVVRRCRSSWLYSSKFIECHSFCLIKVFFHYCFAWRNSFGRCWNVVGLRISKFMRFDYFWLGFVLFDWGISSWWHMCKSWHFLYVKRTSKISRWRRWFFLKLWTFILVLCGFSVSNPLIIVC